MKGFNFLGSGSFNSLTVLFWYQSLKRVVKRGARLTYRIFICFMVLSFALPWGAAQEAFARTEVPITTPLDAPRQLSDMQITQSGELGVEESPAPEDALSQVRTAWITPDSRNLPDDLMAMPERFELRTANSATFQEPGGMFQTVISTDSMHYQDERGNWQVIQPVFQQLDDSFVVQRNTLKSRVGAKRAWMSGMVGETAAIWEVSELGVAGGDGVFTSLATALAETPYPAERQLAGRLLHYVGGWSDPSLLEEIASAPGSLEHSLVLAERPQFVGEGGYLEMRATLELLPGASLWVDGKVVDGEARTRGMLEIRDAAGEPALALSPVVAFEQMRPMITVAGEYLVSPGEEAGTWLVRVRTPLAWWLDPARRYPALIDPEMRVVKSTGYADGMGWVRSNDTKAYTLGGIRLGAHLPYWDTKSRGYVQFNSLPSLLTNPSLQVLSASLDVTPNLPAEAMPYYTNSPTDWEHEKISRNTELYYLGACPDSAGCNGLSFLDNTLTQPSYNWDNSQVGTLVGTKVLKAGPASGGGTPQITTWDVTSQVQSWYTNHFSDTTARPGPTFMMRFPDTAKENCPAPGPYYFGFVPGKVNQISTSWQYVPYCIWFDIPAGSVQLRIAYQSLALNLNDNLLNTPGVPSFLEGIFENTNHQYMLTPAVALQKHWRAVAVRGNHDFDEALPTRVGLQVKDYTTDPSNPELLASGITKEPDETAFVFLDDHAPANLGLSGVDLRAEVTASEQPPPDLETDYLSDLSRNYRIEYEEAVNQTFTYGAWSWLDVGPFPTDKLINLAEFTLNEGDNFIITATAVITMELVLVEPSGGTSRLDAVLGSNDAKVNRNFSPKDSTTRTIFVGSATGGKWAVAAINQARPYVCPDPPNPWDDCNPGEPGILFPQVKILACPEGSIPTARFNCQPLRLPDNSPPPMKTVDIGDGPQWEIFSEGGFHEPGGGNWCTTNEANGAPLIRNVGETTGRWVFVAQGSVCYQGGVLFTTPDSAVGLATAVANFNPNDKRGQFPPGVVYGDASKFPYQAGNPHGRVNATSNGVLLPEADTKRNIKPFDQYWEAEYTQNTDAIFTQDMWYEAEGILSTNVTVDISQPPLDSQWDFAWRLYPNQPPACPACGKYTFDPSPINHSPPLTPQPLSISGMDLRIFQGTVPTGELLELQSLEASSGPVAYQFVNFTSRVTLNPQIGGATQYVVAVVQPPGLPRMPKNQQGCSFEGNATSCLDLREKDYQWVNGKGEKNVQPWALPDIHIEGVAGSVLVSSAGALSVFSADHPASLAGFSQTFSFDTWEVTAEVEEAACIPGGEVTTLVSGHGFVGLPTLGTDGSGPPPWIEVDFKLCGTDLQQAHLELSIPPPGIPVGNTGVGVNLIGGTVTIGPDSTEIKLEIGFQTLDNYLFTDGVGVVTINTAGMFSLKASGKLVGKALIANQVLLEVAWNPLDVLVDAQVSYKSLLWGSLRMHTWVGSGWQNKYPWIQDNKTHFTGQIGATVQIPKGELINKKYLKVPPFTISISAEVAFGEFCNKAGCAPPYPWGMSATVKVFGYGVGVYVDKSGPEIFIGSSSHKLIDQFGGSALSAQLLDASLGEVAEANPIVYNPGAQQAYLAPPFKTPTDAWVAETPGTSCTGSEPTITCTFNVGAGIGKALFVASWQNGGLGVTLIKPDNTEITPSNALANGITISNTVDTNLTMVAFAAQPYGGATSLAIGDWKVRLSNVGVGLPAGFFNNYQLMFAADPPAPKVNWSNPATPGVAPDGSGIVNLAWSALRGGSPIQPGEVPMELFYIPAAQKPITPTVITGMLIADQFYANLGGYAWNTKGLASGEYAVGARLDDHLKSNGHVVSWAPGTVVINDTTPPPEPVVLGQIAVQGGVIVTWFKDLITPDLAGYLVEYDIPDWDLISPLPHVRRVIPSPRNDANYLDIFERVRLGGLPITVSIPINTTICVRAYDASGNVSSCNLIEYTMPESLDERLGPVSAFVPGNTTGDGAIDLYWDVPTFGTANGYLLGYKPTRCLLPDVSYVADEGPPPIVLPDFPFDTTLHGLTPGQWYKFWMQPYNNQGDIGPAVTFEKMILDYTDSEPDGLPDQWEAIFGVSDPSADEDQDLLINLHEYELGTDPLNADSDGDGFYDSEEANPEFGVWISDPCGPDTPHFHEGPKLTVVGLAEMDFTTAVNLPPPPQFIHVMNLGGGALNWMVAASASWIVLDEPAGDGYGAIPIRVDPKAVRSFGTYVGGITITGGQGGRTNPGIEAVNNQIVEQVTIQVTMTVLPPKLLELYLPMVRR